MSFKVVFLHQAESDLKELKRYIIKNFSQSTWQQTYLKIKDSINSLKTFPEGGHIPPELINLNTIQYRQIISGINRIIYEIRQDTIYIHVVCDTRKDLQNLLTKRFINM